MRVACYERVSTQEQGISGISIDAKTAALEEWAKGHFLVGHYTDIGVSGRRPHNKRPELQRLLNDVEANKIDLIIFVRLDRWFRSVKEYYKVQDVLDRHHVAWRAIQEDYETETASGRFKVNIMLSVAQDEAERTGERIKAVNAFKRTKGEFLSGNTAIGTKLENKMLVPSDDAWKVKEMFSVYTATGSVYASIPILADRGIKIGDRSLRYALQNENYLKLGIITPDVWSRTQELRQHTAPRYTKRTYLFSGILFCGECGKRMGGMFRNGIAYYYRCPGYYQDRTCQNSKCYREDEIEKYFLDTILKKVKNVNVKIRTKKPTDPAPLKTKLDKLTDLYLSDLISKEKYEKEYTATKRAIDELETVQMPVDTEQVMSVLSVYKTLSRTAQRAFWHKIIKAAKVTPSGIDYTVSFISG